MFLCGFFLNPKWDWADVFGFGMFVVSAFCTDDNFCGFSLD